MKEGIDIIDKVNEFSKVSVIVATYRRDVTLQKAVESLVNQTYKNIEIIVVDDNAEEEWNKKVQKSLAQYENDKRIIYIQNKENKGSAEGRNVGILAASGEYITFLDDDDLYLPNKIQNQLYGMIRTNADYSLTDLDLYTEEDQLIQHRTRRYLQRENKAEPNLLTKHFMYHMTGTDTLMFKKSYLDKIGRFDPIDIGDEFYLMKKAIEEGGVLYYYPHSDVKAYVHTGENGLSSGKAKINGENKLYQYKETFFNKLNKKSIRYIKMRHYAVLGVVYLKMKNYKGFIKNGFKSFISSPINCIELILKRK